MLKIKQNFFFITLLVVIGFLVYSNSFQNDFHFDDYPNILENTNVHSLLNFEDLKLWLNVNQRAFSLFSFALNIYFTGFNLFGFHLVNIILHVLFSIATFFFIKNLLLFKNNFSKNINQNIYPISFVIASFSLVHPIQVQAVTYIVQRMTLLAGLFYILSCNFYILSRKKHNDYNLRKSFIYYFLTVLFFVLGVLSKQTAVTIPLVWVLIEISFIRNKNNKINYPLIYFLIHIILLPTIIIIMAGKLPKETTEISHYSYFLSQLHVFLKYIQLQLFPVNLMLDYNLPISNHFGFKELLSALLLLSIIMISILIFKKNRLVSFGIFFFFISLLVESSIIPIRDIIYEHRLYLPMVGFFISIVAIIFSFNLSKKIVYYTLILAIFFTGLLTYNRNQVWKNSIELWEDNIQKSPLKSRTHRALAEQYFYDSNLEKAIEHYKKAELYGAEKYKTYWQLGNIYSNINQFDEAEKYFFLSLDLKPSYTKTWINLAEMYDKKNDDDNAFYIYSYLFNNQLSREKSILGLARIYLNRENLSKAEMLLKQLISINPNNVDANYYMSEIYSKLGNIEESLKFLNKAESIKTIRYFKVKIEKSIK